MLHLQYTFKILDTFLQYLSAFLNKHSILGLVTALAHLCHILCKLSLSFSNAMIRLRFKIILLELYLFYFTILFSNFLRFHHYHIIAYIHLFWHNLAHLQGASAFSGQAHTCLHVNLFSQIHHQLKIIWMKCLILMMQTMKASAPTSQ